MLDLATPLLLRLEEGRRVAAVTVTSVARSAPRGLGASMAVTDRGEVIGSISGGCVEGDSIALAHAVLADGTARTARFGFDDETAYAAGLACGGQVEVLAYEITPEMVPALRDAAADRAMTVGIDLATGAIVEDDALDEARLLRETRLVEVPAPRENQRGEGENADIARGSGESPRVGTRRILALSHAPRPRIILCGATEHAAAISRVAAAANYAVTVCDPWHVLVTPERFPDADRLVVDMPQDLLARTDDADARTAVLVLTHDTRLDVPALAQALRMPVGFVGALGARRTVQRRAELLRDEHGATDADIARIHSPLGLDLGGSSPEATALSVMAEVVAARFGGSGAPLRETTGPIHRDRPPKELACAQPHTDREVDGWI